VTPSTFSAATIAACRARSSVIYLKSVKRFSEKIMLKQ